MRFDVRYYLIAILFIIFDLEIAFVFPWAIVFDELGVVRSCRNGHVSVFAGTRFRLRLEEGSPRMGMSDSNSRVMHNPAPPGPVDDILRPGDDNPLMIAAS